MPVSFPVNSNLGDYEVKFQPDSSFLRELAGLPRACFVVDEIVWRLYEKELLSELPAENVIILPVNEGRKNLDTVQELYDRLVLHPARRSMTLVSIGGGIVQDVSGFAASTLYRGVKWVFIPTTLLAQADSCIGSKTSLNFRGYKNLIGTFYPPAQVHIYPPFLSTLAEPDFFSGLGEVIKLHLMGGEVLMREAMESLPGLVSREPAVLLKAIQSSLRVKLSYMAGDEFDTGRRNLLNYGHDFGHALESSSDFAVPHGQAVIFGMLAANVVARNRGLLAGSLAAEIADRLLRPALKVMPAKEALKAEIVVEAMLKDKKRTGDLLVMIFLRDGFELGKMDDLSPIEVDEALRECTEYLGLS